MNQPTPQKNKDIQQTNFKFRMKFLAHAQTFDRGGSRPPRSGGILGPRVFALMTDHESEDSGVENELSGSKILYFLREERWLRRIRRIVA